MGTHPIFESDFDCLTANQSNFVSLWSKRLKGVNRAIASSLRLLDSPHYAIDFLRGLAEAEETSPSKMALLYEALKIALHSGSSQLLGEVRLEMSSCAGGSELDEKNDASSCHGTCSNRKWPVDA